MVRKLQDMNAFKYAEVCLMTQNMIYTHAHSMLSGHLKRSCILLWLGKVFLKCQSILWCSVFFMAQLSYPYMATGKNIALTISTFVRKVTSLLFNMLSRFVIAFRPRSKCLLISWLQSPCAVILEPKKIKCHCFHFSSFYLP